MASQEPTLLEEREEEVAVLTLNRPEVRNALNRATISSLHGALKRLGDERGARALIITGAGERAFSAGADLKEREGMSEPQARDYLSLLGETFRLIEELPQPVIAAINGGAFGGGFELALVCDIRIAAEHARMGLTEVSLGIIPGGGGTQRLPRLVGRARAKELILTARVIDTAEAERMGLLSAVFPKERLMAEALALARTICANAPIAVRQAKRAINFGMETHLREGLALEREAYESCLTSRDRLEALAAFREKRKPHFAGE